MSQMLYPQKPEFLEKWLQETNTTLTQINGQRRYGGPPPEWKGPVPGPGCEVFINQIPRDVYEDRLIPLFQSVAPLYEFRLMMNFSGQNRGFAYAKYGDPASAAAAIRALNMYPLENGAKLTVRRSTEKRQLCLSDLPPNTGRNELLMALHQIVDGVEGVTISTTGQKEKEVTALVHYTSHYAASMAKKVLVQAFKKLYGVSISIRWMCGSEKCEKRPLVPPRLKTSTMNSIMPTRFRCSQETEDPPPVPTASSVIHPQSSQAVGASTPEVLSKMLPFKPRSNTGELQLDSVHQLRCLCKLQGLGVPLYNMRYKHVGPDGFLYFSYRVMIPGLAVPFLGVVHILPHTCPNNIEAEVQRAVAKQLLSRIMPMKNL